MFQSLRPNSQIYILHKDNNRRLETGYVTNQPITRPKYQITPSFGQPQELIVDITVKVNDQLVNYNNLPAQLDIADSISNNESIVISDSREAMNAEVMSLKQKSLDIIKSVPLHEDCVKDYDKILLELNPDYAEKQQQKLEIDELKSQISNMANSISELMLSNKKLIEKLKKED